MSGRGASGVVEVGDDTGVFSRSVKRKFFRLSAYRWPAGARGASARYECSLRDTPFWGKQQIRVQFLR